MVHISPIHDSGIIAYEVQIGTDEMNSICKATQRIARVLNNHAKAEKEAKRIYLSDDELTDLFRICYKLSGEVNSPLNDFDAIDADSALKRFD